MRFTYDETAEQQEIADAIAFLEDAFQMDGFWQGLAELPPFTQLGDRSCTPPVIAARMQACAHPVAVRHYTQDSSATARVRSGNPFVIEINTKFFGRGTRAYVNTLCHEFVHVVDYYADEGGRNGRFDYGHSWRHTRKRPRSAPYRIGTFAEEWWDLAHQHDPDAGKAKSAALAIAADMLDCDIEMSDVVILDDDDDPGAD